MALRETLTTRAIDSATIPTDYLQNKLTSASDSVTDPRAREAIYRGRWVAKKIGQVATAWLAYRIGENVWDAAGNTDPSAMVPSIGDIAIGVGLVVPGAVLGNERRYRNTGRKERNFVLRDETSPGALATTPDSYLDSIDLPVDETEYGSFADAVEEFEDRNDGLNPVVRMGVERKQRSASSDKRWSQREDSLLNAAISRRRSRKIKKSAKRVRKAEKALNKEMARNDTHQGNYETRLARMNTKVSTERNLGARPRVREVKRTKAAAASYGAARRARKARAKKANSTLVNLPAAQERFGEVIAKHQETLDKYGNS